MVHSIKFAVLAAIVSTSFTLQAHDDDFHQEAPHVHGEAVLNIVREHNQITLELLSPAFNIVGFEHAPNTNEQQQTVNNARDLLLQPDKLFSFGKANCQIQQPTAVVGLPEHHKQDHEHDHDHDHDHDHHKHTHKDIQVIYHVNCQDLPSATAITVKLFEQFQQLEKINAQWISANQQGAAMLTATTNNLSL